jgi:2-phosphosulfolactate phosphatase
MAIATTTAIMIQIREGIGRVAIVGMVKIVCETVPITDDGIRDREDTPRESLAASGRKRHRDGINATRTSIMIHWHCHDLYQRLPSGGCTGGIAVVIDVLRASTTMVAALAQGAARVVPVADVDEARRLAAECRPTALLGGERGGVRIPGFDFGNSPREYSAARVAGKTVVITTTNGTAALAAARGAREILVGTIVNRSAVVDAIRRLAGPNEHVHLVCAGTDGLVSAEDVLAAGAILDAAGADRNGDRLDADAREALVAFRHVAANGDVPAALVAEFRRSPGGANLVALGMEADLPAAAAIDSLPLVPRFDYASGSLCYTPAHGQTH